MVAGCSVPQCGSDADVFLDIRTADGHTMRLRRCGYHAPDSRQVAELSVSLGVGVEVVAVSEASTSRPRFGVDPYRGRPLRSHLMDVYAPFPAQGA